MYAQNQMPRSSNPGNSEYNTGMESQIAERLLELNHQFYQTFADEFSKTRQRIQPGARRILEKFPPGASILDLGCGNGETQREIRRLGHRGVYVGIDVSPGLLTIARSETAGQNERFLLADLARPDWAERLSAAWAEIAPGKSLQFDIILAFAVLHHIPSQAWREQILSQVHALLRASGQFIHSEWQFLNSPRLAARVQAWERVGLQADQVDPGDYLIDWRAGGQGLRYIHLFDEQELAELAVKSGFKIDDSFYSDGEGNNLGLYQVWSAVK